MRALPARYGQLLGPDRHHSVGLGLQACILSLIVGLSAAIPLLGPNKALAGQDDPPLVGFPTADQTEQIPRVRLLREIPDTEYPKSTPSAITWSPSGDRLAANTLAGTQVNVWDADWSIVAKLNRFGAGWDGETIAFLDGSREIATPPASYKSNDVAVSIFDVATAHVIHEIPGPDPSALRVHNRAHVLAVSPDQSVLAAAVGTWSDSWPIRLYSAKTWEFLGELPLELGSNQDGVRTMAFAAKAPRLAVAAGIAANILLVYDTQSRKVILKLGEYPNDFGVINAVAITPDGEYVAVGVTPIKVDWTFPNGTPAPRGQGKGTSSNLPERVRVYRVADGVLVGSLTDVPTAQYDIKWRPLSHVLALVAGDDAIYFGNPFRSNKAELRIPLGRGAVSLAFIPLGRGAVSLAFSPDGTKLAAGGNATLFIYSLENPK